MNRNYIKIIFVILLFYIFFSGIGSYGLLSKDEPRYAGCALEMIENHNWIVPKFNFQNRFDKPPLFYWLIAISYKVFGINEFASRVPSATSAVLLVLFTWYAGNRIIGKNTGLLSAVILATSIEYIALGRRAATDIVLCLFFTATLYSFYLYYNEKEERKKILWAISSGIFEGLAILTKGPAGIILPSLVIGLFLIVRKEVNLKHLKVLSLISFIAIALSLPWYIVVHLATDGEFTRDFFILHNVQRFTSVVGEHPGPVWFYFPVVLIGFMPWTFFLINALLNLITRIRRLNFNKFILFCILWSFIIFLFFTLSKTKLFTYILLIFPSMALITGYWINIFGKRHFNKLKISILVLLSILIAGLLIGALILLPKLNLQELDKNILITRLYISSVFIIIGSIILFITTKRHFSLIIFFIFIFSIPGIYILNPAIKASYMKSFYELEKYSILAREMGAKEIISYVGYKPILVYYGRMPVDFSSQKKQLSKIQKQLKESKNIFIIVHESDVEKVKYKLFNNHQIHDRFKIVASGKKYALVKLN